MNYPPPHAQPPLQPVKKKGNGCLIAIAIVGVVFFVGAVAVGVGAYAFIKSDKGQQATSLMSEGINAASAPGTAELRAAGCTQAMVMDLQKLAAIGNTGQDAAAVTAEYRFAVTCTVNKSEGAPTCDDVARIYRTAVSPVAPFSTSVLSHTSQTTCSTLYKADGTKIRSLR